jgi:DNA polymerase III subunit epsilon
MGLLAKETFICIDCESTGLDTNNDRIIEIAICKFTFDQVIDSYETLVDPKREIPEESILIHHITQDMVEGKPQIQDILKNVLDMKERYTIVGHGIAFDINLITQEAKRHGIKSHFERNQVIDTLRLARLYGKSPTNSLAMLREHFNIPDHGAHRAMSDVLVNIEVFKYLSSSYNTTQSLMKRLERPIQLMNMPLGKHKGRPFKEVPIDYLNWAKHQNFDEDLSYSIRMELKNRKRGNQFSLSSNPFQDLN